MSEHLVELHIANHGTITLELNAEKAPKTVANFLEYVKEGHYDGTIFHRVIDGFMIHAGQPTKDFVDRAVRSILLRQGVLGIKVKIMLPYDPTGKQGPKRPLPDSVTVLEPKEDLPAAQEKPEEAPARVPTATAA